MNEFSTAVKMMFPHAINQFGLEEARARIASTVLQPCHDHNEFDVDRIDAVIASYSDDGREDADTESAFLLTLKDGKYAVASESGDGTGHG